MGQVFCWFLLANVPSSNSPDRKTKKHTMSGLNIEQHCATLQRIADVYKRQAYGNAVSVDYEGICKAP